MPGGLRCGTGGLGFGGGICTGGACFGALCGVCVATTCVPGFGGADLATLVSGGSCVQAAEQDAQEHLIETLAVLSQAGP